MADDKKEKKKFKDTKLGGFISKAGKFLPNVAEFAADALLPGKVGTVVSNMISGLKEEGSAEAIALAEEMELKRMEIELEFEKLEIEELALIVQDLDSARNREVEIAKLGKGDWKMGVVLIFGLLLFGFIAYVIVFVTVPEENQTLFHHLVGMIEGAVAIKVFNYYFGSSKGSSDKNVLMSNNRSK